jgi:hypothetical protein
MNGNSTQAHDHAPRHDRTSDQQTSRKMEHWGTVGAVSGILSFIACIIAANDGIIGGKYSVALIAAAWAVLPPVWFLCEYFYRFRTSRSNPGTWEYLKHAQQLRVAGAGFAASIGAFALSPLSDPAKSAKPDLKCAVETIAAAASSSFMNPVTFDVTLRCKT